MSKKRNLISFQGVLGFTPNVSFYSQGSSKEKSLTKFLKKYFGF